MYHNAGILLKARVHEIVTYMRYNFNIIRSVERVYLDVTHGCNLAIDILGAIKIEIF